MALPVTHIDHCSVIVTDVAASRRFYGEQLGLREIPPPKTFDFVALWYDLAGSYLHLLLKPQRDAISPRHFCLHVPDIAPARAPVPDQGIRIDDTGQIPR